MAKQEVTKEAEKIRGGATMKPILIVEDETVVRDSLRDWLTESGYQVETAKEGEEALETLSQKEYGIVILDLRLPGKDGIEVLREAKEKRPQLKGVIITAYPSVPTAVEAMKEGALEYLPKPVDLNELEKIIRDTLGPVQVAIKPIEVKEKAPAKPVVEEAKVEAVKKLITIPREEIPVHIKQGKEHFEAGRYQKALTEFESVLAVAPGNIEVRVWLPKTREAMTRPMVEGEAVTEGKVKECVWVKMGMVAPVSYTHLTLPTNREV